jgi:hypothetical protein
MFKCLENRELKIKEVEINEIYRLLDEICVKKTRLKNNLHKLIEVENDTNILFELNSLIVS